MPNVPVVDQDGRSYRFAEDLVKDHVVLVNVMYTRCDGKCLGAADGLKAAQDALGERVGRDVRILSISIDPENDTPDVLKAYAEAHDAGPGWYFLTGAPPDIEQLRKRLGFTDPDPVVDADRSQHAAIVLLGNEPRARWTMAVSATDLDGVLAAFHRVTDDPRDWKPWFPR